jgi:hypothetical protein
MDNSKHMVSDPTAAAAQLTEGSKAAGGMVLDPITIRVSDLAEAAPIVAKLKADGVNPWTYVRIVENRFDTRLTDGRLRDL